MAIDAIAGSTSAGAYQSTQNVAPVETNVKVENVSTSSESTVDSAAASKTKEFVISDDNNGRSTVDKDEKASNESLKRAVEEINKKAHNQEAQFGIHEETGRMTIKIVDKDTKEVLKEFPPEKTLDMIAKVWELAGLLVDEKR
jgi:flagellar protein FlaG